MFIWTHININKQIFCCEVGENNLNRLPREAEDTQLKARLDKALSNLVYWEFFLPMAGGLEKDDL